MAANRLPLEPGGISGISPSSSSAAEIHAQVLRPRKYRLLVNIGIGRNAGYLVAIAGDIGMAPHPHIGERAMDQPGFQRRQQPPRRFDAAKCLPRRRREAVRQALDIPRAARLIGDAAELGLLAQNEMRIAGQPA